MSMFALQSTFKPISEQEKASDALSTGIKNGDKHQVLLGVTGSGKTFTVAQIIQKLQMPALIISHNKTLAGQLYQEMRDFFPKNAVSYFVSYYDYYQPEAYVPQTDTYIEKEAEINDLIDKLRLAATSNILTRKDVIVVASVSCIYNIGSPVEYGKFILSLNKGDKINEKNIFKRLVELQYERSQFDFKRGTFRVRSQSIDIYPAYEDISYRITLQNERIESITSRNPLTGKLLNSKNDAVVIYPAKHYMIGSDVFLRAEQKIRDDLKRESSELKKRGKNLEAERLIQKVNYDLEMMKEMGYVNGIENYSRYFDGRSRGDPPYTLLDYFSNQYGNHWLNFIDESHMTIPQIRGMFNGDQSRKNTLIEYGFRLKAALDNRPLKFDEFYNKVPYSVYLSATPNEWEKNESQGKIVEQLVRPTGIVDPMIKIKPTQGDIDDLIIEIRKKIKKKQRVLVTTLTKRTAEDLSTFLKEKNINSVYLHSDIKTLERTDILQKLRRKEYDVLIGVNLLREGLDLPEVTLVAILDGDKEGFLRSKTSLIQTMGRAARNVEGEVVIYADNITKSMKAAIDEVQRRRLYQVAYNNKHNIKPRNIEKQIRDDIIKSEFRDKLEGDKNVMLTLDRLSVESMTAFDKKKTVRKLELAMRKYAEQLDFESAILIRDKVRELNSQ
ncbi:excinuclease ABC subunit B [Candidatus Roizmanbacteria bacterium RIFCSPHIGHO2_02_FULL_37_24]|uniref:UvrABC system protein B n=1 Tax=Candidatus Roizmanbacteria bacterium RIFCSPHIGHO2_02_FULL_37_24 TaxID=1802037 RepID=A0A1F7GU87_9BACT|nr:MAG: excinuclease ABC subunit B [Candidatus Roizmanbacteria bacterium RIFCSPHIGHO2_02_FULL_37_24]OGK33275.1 MAG: excinuclease ABC subunit B [Candidatus Roizmanbacteria bacterium RIFCSPHIGHO2_12_FULL_37_23]OGK43313.1 MAG: excinuclease ABC subunit B [Candidatus Roizmanbacteria bacterium RIFCSPLOWO2_01_FULL_37_57]